MDCDQDDIDMKEAKEKQVEQIRHKPISKKMKKAQKQEEQEVEPDLECSICYGTIKDKGILPECNHTFCFKCIEIWAKKKQTCPQCRVPFNKINRIWKKGKRLLNKNYEFNPIQDSNSQDSDGDHLVSLEIIMNTNNYLQFFSLPLWESVIDLQRLL